MSQAGLARLTKGVLPPVVPIQFTTNSGIAVPVLGNLNILGTVVSAGTNPFIFVGSGSTVTGEIQISQAIASSNAANIGLSAFNSAEFTVDANGFVSLVGSGSPVETLTGNSGTATPSANNINVITANTTVKFVGSGSTLTQDFGLSNLILGNSATSISSANSNVGLGIGVFNSLSSGVSNTAIGRFSGRAISTASANTLVGANSGSAITTSQANTAIGTSALGIFSTGAANAGSNTAIGNNSLNSLATGIQNSGVGDSSLLSITTGSNNIAIGYQAGSNHTTSDSSNIEIGNLGTAGVSNTISIGTQGSGAGQQNECFIAGITGVTVSSPAVVTLNTTTGQLGELAQLSVGLGGTGAATLTGILTGNGTSAITASTVTQHGVLVGALTNSVSSTAVGTTGQVLTGVTGADPVWASPATSGTVTSVTGTANQVAVATGTTTPVISLIGPYTPSTYTAHGVLIGEGTSSIAALGAGTAGQVLQSGGASTDPSYSTATFPSAVGGAGTQLRSNGTTGWVASTIVWGNALTANDILYASSTNTQGQITSANNAVLTTNSSGVPAMTALGNSQLIATNSTGTVAARALSLNVQTFTSAGTYTPTSGMLYCKIEVLGNGGGGAGVPLTSVGNFVGGGGGGAGEYQSGVFSATTIGASKSVTFGATGTGGVAGQNNGTAGGTVAVTGVISAAGGSGGISVAQSSTSTAAAGGAGGTGGSGGSVITPGTAGGFSVTSFTGVFLFSGQGASSQYGSGGQGLVAVAAGNNAGGYGAGGGGALNNASQAAGKAGGNGSTGIVIITEYVIA